MVLASYRKERTESENQRKKYYIFTSVFNHSYWVLGTALGVLTGSLISFNTEGIDFALTALFVTVFLEQWLTAKKYIPALVGVGASVICLLIFGSDKFLIPAMLIIALLLCLYKENKKGEAENE